MKAHLHSIGYVDCELCKHYETDVCGDCSIVLMDDRSCSCHIDSPCSVCEKCLFEKKEEGFMVDVIEFRLPDGKKIPHSIYIDKRCEEKYKLLKKLHCQLHAEILTTGEVSQTINAEDGYDFAIVITSGKDTAENKAKLEEMILSFDEAEYKKFIDNQE